MRNNKAVGLYTPGPWKQHESGDCDCGYVFGDGGEVYVAKALSLADGVDPVASDELRAANARLIAAAPDLLRLACGAYHLCRSLLATREAPPDALIQEMAEALADAIANAIAKAEGR